MLFVVIFAWMLFVVSWAFPPLLFVSVPLLIWSIRRLGRNHIHGTTAQQRDLRHKERAAALKYFTQGK